MRIEDIETGLPKWNNRFEEALPRDFSFYGLGNVLLSDSSGQLYQSLEKINHGHAAYRVHFKGELQGALILFFSEEWDSTLFAEMGNIIASRCANHLEKEHEMEVMITPPEPMTAAQIRQIGLRKPAGVVKTYRFSNLGHEIQVHVLVLSMRMQEAGHA